METGRVLLVEAEPTSRLLYGGWLEDSGYEVMTCPGPRAPGYTCVGGRTGACPLIDPADVVVVGLDLDSEIEQEGTSAFELLSLYTASGKPVVAFGSDPDIVGVLPEGLATGLVRPPVRPQLLEAVRTSIARAAG
jgi:CheY-like chemotaxis protein